MAFNWASLMTSAGGFWESAKAYVLGVGIAAALGVIGTQYLIVQSQAKQIKAGAAEIARLNDQVTLLTKANGDLADKSIAGEDVAAIAAKACKSSIKFRAQNTVESKVIADAPDDVAAVRAYDDLMCARPEAQGHPRCSGTPAEAPR
jgi:hypothetical protein